MSRRLTPRERVLIALRNRGYRGITARDFAPGAVDGGRPIDHLHAIVDELCDDGYVITEVDGRFALALEPTHPAGDAIGLFDAAAAAAAPQCAVFDDGTAKGGAA